MINRYAHNRYLINVKRNRRAKMVKMYQDNVALVKTKLQSAELSPQAMKKIKSEIKEKMAEENQRQRRIAIFFAAIALVAFFLFLWFIGNHMVEKTG